MNESVPCPTDPYLPDPLPDPLLDLLPGPLPEPGPGIASVTRLAEVRWRRHPSPRPVHLDGGQPVLPFPDGDPAEAAPRARLRLVTGPDDEIEQVAARLAQLLVEVLAGDRAVHQLMRWVSPSVYRTLLRRMDSLHRLAPLPRPGSRRIRLLVRSVHVGASAAGCAEIAVHIRHGARSRAVALRLEVEDGRWRCSALGFD